MIQTTTIEFRAADVLHRHIRETLFHPGTNLFYDYITDRDPAKRFRHLPTPAEIARQFPNPCGWGTGMEDCALNAGNAMDTLRLRRELFGEDNLEFALRILDGIHRCATVHGQPGFIVRGISPHDGKSCYTNSSRDQFTLAVYALWRFLQGYPDAPEAAKEKARSILRAVAELCHERNTPEHGFSLPRLDGGPAIVSKLWHCAPHEMMRLPMFYGMAYAGTGESKYREWMEECAPAGIEATLEMDPAAYWWDFSLSQMMLSLGFFRETGLIPALDRQLDEAIRRGVALTHRDLLLNIDAAEVYPGEWETLNANWRRLPMLVTPETLSDDGFESTFGGVSYLNPRFPSEYLEPNSFLRTFGNDIFALYCGGTTPNEEECSRISALLAEINPTRCGGAGVIQLSHAMHLTLSSGIEL